MIIYIKCSGCKLKKLREFKEEENYNKGYGKALAFASVFSNNHAQHGKTTEYTFFGLIGKLEFKIRKLLNLL